MGLLGGITGIPSTANLDYEPTSVQAIRLIYTIFDRSEPILDGGTVEGWRYFFTSTLCLKWQDNEGAEQELDPYINAIPLALRGNIGLGLDAVNARIDNLDGGYLTIAGTKYRVCIVSWNVLDKGDDV